MVPVLCSPATSIKSSRPKGLKDDFCSKVWETCRNTAILNSPFSPPLQSVAGKEPSSKYTKLTDISHSRSAFSETFCGSSDLSSICFNGLPVSLDYSQPSHPPSGICVEKIGNGEYTHMIAHPDGSSRAFVANTQGKIWLATIPIEGSGGKVGLDESHPFLDLTDKVHYDTICGLVAIAFHPNFVRNGRFFVSFCCDEVQWPGCAGRCACNSDMGCDPSMLSSDNGVPPCQNHIVVVEFTTNGSTSQPSLATKANPLEVRRIFTLGMPYQRHHCGQILFGPADECLYFLLGDGENRDDPYNFAQNKKSLLGKIIRLDINNIPSEKEISDLGLWGNYSIPKDNPYFRDNQSRPEIWALGLRNPWRCTFDLEKPSYFLCGDSGKEQYEEVDIITKGGNYGWNFYEGNFPMHPPPSPGGNTPSSSINSIFPVMGYNHSNGSSMLIGGFVYRSITDPCLYGRYLYADLYGALVWVGEETPTNSGNFTTTQVPFTCAYNSPIHCSLVNGSHLPEWGYVVSFGEDNKKDVFFLTSKGLYRIVSPSRCHYTCSLEKNAKAVGDQVLGSTSFSCAASRLWELQEELLLLVSCSLFLILGFIQ